MKVNHICSASSHVILTFPWPWVQTAMDGDDEYGYDDDFTEEDLHFLEEIELAAYGGVFFPSIGSWCHTLRMIL